MPPTKSRHPQDTNHLYVPEWASDDVLHTLCTNTRSAAAADIPSATSTTGSSPAISFTHPQPPQARQNVRMKSMLHTHSVHSSAASQHTRGMGRGWVPDGMPASAHSSGSVITAEPCTNHTSPDSIPSLASHVTCVRHLIADVHRGQPTFTSPPSNARVGVREPFPRGKRGPRVKHTFGDRRGVFFGGGGGGGE